MVVLFEYLCCAELPPLKPTQYFMQHGKGHYEYGYNTGNSAKYEIRMADGTTRGSYSYADPNDVLRITSYFSDQVNGYQATNLEHRSVATGTMM